MTKKLKMIRDFEREDFEKRNHREIAVIPFSPDFEMPNADTPSTKIKIMANDLQHARTGDNIVKVTVPTFESGTFEEVLVCGRNGLVPLCSISRSRNPWTNSSPTLPVIRDPAKGLTKRR